MAEEKIIGMLILLIAINVGLSMLIIQINFQSKYNGETITTVLSKTDTNSKASLVNQETYFKPYFNKTFTEILNKIDALDKKVSNDELK